MINYQEIKEALFRLNSSKDDALISHQFTGLLAGIALAVKDPQLARTIDHNLRTQWTDTHKPYDSVPDAGRPYGPGQMAEALIGRFKDKAGTSN